MVYQNINKIELLVCLAKSGEQNFFLGGEHKFPVCQKVVKQEFQRVWKFGKEEGINSFAIRREWRLSNLEFPKARGREG